MLQGLHPLALPINLQALLNCASMPPMSLADRIAQSILNRISEGVVLEIFLVALALAILEDFLGEPQSGLIDLFKVLE